MKIIAITKGKEVIIDEVDYKAISKYKWQYSNRGYCVRSDYNSKKTIMIHRVIMGNPKKGLVVDHINGNKLDNRKSNLRICTYSDNKKNSKKYKKCSSKYKGVHLHTQAKRYWSRITINKKRVSLGLFKNEIDAAIAYNEAALKHYGEFARLNIINN